MKRHNIMQRAAFTLVELMIVLAILVGLAGIGVVSYTRIKAGADKKTAKLLIQQTASAVELFYAAVGTYPATEDGLQALLTAPEDEKMAEKWRGGGGPFLKKGQIPTDPWGNELKYELVEDASSESGGPTFHIWSLGPDKQEGTDDDIRSWSEESAT